MAYRPPLGTPESLVTDSPPLREPPLFKGVSQSLEVDPPPLGLLRILGAEVLPLGVPFVSWERMYRPLGDPIFTVGGCAAVRSAAVAGSSHTAMGCNSSQCSPFCMEL